MIVCAFVLKKETQLKPIHLRNPLTDFNWQGF